MFVAQGIQHHACAIEIDSIAFVEILFGFGLNDCGQNKNDIGPARSEFGRHVRRGHVKGETSAGEWRAFGRLGRHNVNKISLNDR